MRELEEIRKKQEEELELKKAEMMMGNSNDDMKRQLEEQLAEEKMQFELRLQEQQEELARQKQAFEEEQRVKALSNAEEQHKLQQFQEIDRQLQEIVPKIAELNAICSELGKD